MTTFSQGESITVTFIDGSVEVFDFVVSHDTYFMAKDQVGNRVLVPFANVKHIVG